MEHSQMGEISDSGPNDPGRRKPTFTANGLPAVMRESLVGLRHLVRVLALLHRATFVARRRQQFCGEALAKRVVGARLRITDEPTDRQGIATVGANLDRHLVVGASHASRLDLEDRLDVGHRLLEDRHGILPGLLLESLHRAVEVALGKRTLAASHHAVHEARHENVLESWIRHRFAPGDTALTRHSLNLFLDIARRRARETRNTTSPG